MATVRWILADPSEDETWQFNVNPNQDNPIYQKTVTFQPLLVPGAPPLIFEGQDQAIIFSVQGTILSQTQYIQFYHWYNKRRQVALLDDLNRLRWIYITEFQPLRVPSAVYAWKHSYTLSGYVMSEPSIDDAASTVSWINGDTMVPFV